MIGDEAAPFFRLAGRVWQEVRTLHALTDEARLFLDTAATMAAPATRGRRLFTQLCAEVAAAAGETPLAFDYVRQSVAAGLRDLPFMDHVPLLHHVRVMDGFDALRADVATRAAHVVKAWQAPRDELSDALASALATRSPNP